MRVSRTKSASAFSLLEVLTVVSVIAITAGVGISLMSGLLGNAKEEKLRQDVQVLNSAVKSYLASGGSLDATATPQSVLDRLKSVATSEIGFRLPGFSSSMVDPRIALRMLPAEEAASSTSRAIWNRSKQRFDLATSGSNGVKEFFLSDDLAEVKPGTENRDAVLLYAKEDTWVWDYQDRAPGRPIGPAGIPLEEDPGTPPVGATPNQQPLNPPLFSIPSSIHPYTEFDLSLDLTNPNESGSSEIWYAVDFGAWKKYTGTLAVAYSTTVEAQAIAIDSVLWRDSKKRTNTYSVAPFQLQPPQILPSALVFDHASNKTISVSLTNPNDSAISELEYRIEGGQWSDYAGDFQLREADFLNGATIEARAVPTAAFAIQSTPVSVTIGAALFSISGQAEGQYYGPSGGPNLVTNLTGGQKDSYFEWGEAVAVQQDPDANENDTGDPQNSASSLVFVPVPFADVEENERFLVGQISYFNGTIISGTGANSVELLITLDIANAPNLKPFEHSIELVNTPNSSDPVASADFVRLSLGSDTPVKIGQREYMLYLEFGETDDDGFATISEFHVFEQETALGNLYGRLVRVN